MVKVKLSWRSLLPLFLVLFFFSLLSPSIRRAPWYEQWAWNIVSPAVSFASMVKRGTARAWRHYVYLVHTAKENDQLKKALGQAGQTQLALAEFEYENRRLRKLLDLRENMKSESVVAQVLGLDPRSEWNTLRINRGAADGLAPHQPVLGVEGLVGRVGPVFEREALVLMIVDPASHLDVMVQRSRVRALLTGLGSLKHLELRHATLLTQLEYLKKTSDVKVGDIVLTSGFDGVFPKGILVGTIEKIGNTEQGIFAQATVRPRVDFSQIEEVLVLLKP